MGEHLCQSTGSGGIGGGADVLWESPGLSGGNVIKWWVINGFCITGLRRCWSRVTEG